MIETRHVTKTYNAGLPNEFTAVNDVSIAVPPDSVSVLKGPSGSGKTTLLAILGCMARPTSGRVHISGREITSLPERFMTDVRRRTFGFIFQQFNLIRGLTVLENVMAPAYPDGEPYGALKERALGLLDRFHILPKYSSKVEWLSGGEAQRLAIARSLINDPSMIIADEPTAHLDTKLSREFMTIMKELKAGGKTILIASHDPVVFDSDLVTTVIEMRDGRISS